MNGGFTYHGTNPSGACHQLVWGKRKRKGSKENPKVGFSCLELGSIHLMLYYSNYVSFAKGIVVPLGIRIVYCERMRTIGDLNGKI